MIITDRAMGNNRIGVVTTYATQISSAHSAISQVAAVGCRDKTKSLPGCDRHKVNGIGLRANCLQETVYGEGIVSLEIHLHTGLDIQGGVRMDRDVALDQVRRSRRRPGPRNITAWNNCLRKR